MWTASWPDHPGLTAMTPTATEMGTGPQHARVHVVLPQTLADLDRLRVRRAWPAEVDPIWEVLDEIKEAMKLGEFLRRQALLTWESFAPLTEIIGTVIDAWPEDAWLPCRCWSLSSPWLLALLRSCKSRRHSDQPQRTLRPTTDRRDSDLVPPFTVLCGN